MQIKSPITTESPNAPSVTLALKVGLAVLLSLLTLGCGGGGHRLNDQQWDQVVSMPDGARLLAKSGHCEHFLIEFNDTMMGIQGHPEFTPEYIEVLLDLRRDRIPPEVCTAAEVSLGRSHDKVCPTYTR